MSEGQIAEFIKNDEVQSGQLIGETALPPVAALGLEPIDEIDHVINRPREPERMQLLAMAMAKWVLPVPVPPTSTTLRCWAMKPPPASSFTSVSLIGVPSNWKSSRSLASGSLAMVSW